MAVRRSRGKAQKKPRRSIAPGLAAGVAALAAVPASAATFTVTNLNDTGAGSLRDALASANNAAGADVITFQAGLTGTITLTTGQLYVGDDVDIQGPGPSILTVSGNNASRVFYLYDSDVTLNVRIAGLTITQGNETIGAGVVDFDENLVLDDVVITQNNSTGDGAGLWADGFNMSLSILNSTISGNTSGDDGGGIYIEDTGGPMLIDNSVITGNQAADSGGGIYLYDPDDDITIRDTTISGNTAACCGGGIYLYSFDNGGLTIEGSTISGNNASFGAGMNLYSIDAGASRIENTTISGNHATIGAGGVYLYALYGTTLTLNFVTLANNTADTGGGGMVLLTGSADVTNSIIADNTAPTDVDLLTGPDGSFDLSYTLLETPGTANISNTTGNILNTDPQLGALANNGGPTQTQRPALTSPVLNVADPAFTPPPATDQRGEARVYAGRADMGALELAGGVLQFNPTTATVAENTPGFVTLTVTRDIGPDPATVDYATAPGTASAGADFTTTSGTLNFAAGDLSESFNVPILDDAFIEGNEQFTASLSNPSTSASIGAANTATVTITDFEPGQVLFASATYSVNESSPGFLTVTVNRVNGSSGPASVNYTTAPGSATAGAGNDYTTTSGTLNWADGDTAPKTFNIPILDDAAAEGNETFTVSLSTPSGATLGAPATSTVTIVDDPAGTAQFSIASAGTTEEAGSVTVTVTRIGGTEGPLTVNYATANGTATAPGDFTATSGVITFPAGDATPQSFNIPIINDSLAEGDEMFTVNLTGASTAAPSTLSITITANDQAPIPALSFFGKMLLAMFSAVAGLYAIVRSRISMVLFAIVLIGLTAGPTLSASPKRDKEHKGSKLNGTLVSVANNGTTTTLTLSGGVTITLPTKSVQVVDARKAKHQDATLEQVVQGSHVTVKTETDSAGNIVKARIKLKP